MDAATKQKTIDAINKRVEKVTADDLQSLKEFNCTSWGEYIIQTAENSDISIGEAYSIWQMMGPSEAFDGFVTSCEDAAHCLSEREEDEGEF